MSTSFVRTSILICLAATPLATGQSSPAKVIEMSGKVLGVDGSPAKGAMVWTARVSSGPLEWHETVADEKGAFRFKLNPGSWYVWARQGTQGTPHQIRN